MEINPLAWYGTQLITEVPDHFIKFKFKLNIDIVELIHWIGTNCHGRVGIGKIITRYSDPSIKMEEKYIGFENEEDAILYSLKYN